MDLVAFRDSDGRIGLLDEYFAHRRLAFSKPDRNWTRTGGPLGSATSRTNKAGIQ